MPIQGLATAQAATEDVAVDRDLPSQVHTALTDYLETRRVEAEHLDRDFARAIDDLVRFILAGGKRIRPTFAWWGWRAVGGAAEGRASAMITAASSLELIHACALIHDDLLDDSDTRRGNPTIHVKHAEAHQSASWSGEPRQFGMAAAVLLGDLALAWADDMMHSAGLAPPALARALRPWQAMRTEVLAGQYLDVLGQARRDETAQAALRIDQLKAASYTVRRPLEFGAEIAGAPPRTLDALRRFGSDIGVAFQLRDDVLGVFGDPEITGKPAGDDLREGKRTLLIAEAFNSAKTAEDTGALDLLHAVLGDPDLDESRVERAREALIELGAVRAVENRIAELTDTALIALRSGRIAEPAATQLAELAVAVTHRTR